MSDIPVKEIGELLDEVSGKVPKLISGIIETLYSAEAGTRMGKSVGNLYKELIDSGIPKEEALQMAKDYMLTMKSMLNAGASNTNFGGKGSGGNKENFVPFNDEDE